VSGTVLAARASARLLTVCAVLAGLFFMHALLAQGCPGGTGMPASATPASVMPVAAMADQHTEATGHGATPHAPAAVPTHTAADNGVCVATPPKRNAAGGLAYALALAAAVSTALPRYDPRMRRRGRGATHRAPPLGGAALLTALRVSRT
jgi:hypothetical protein